MLINFIKEIVSHLKKIQLNKENEKKRVFNDVTQFIQFRFYIKICSKKDIEKNDFITISSEKKSSFAHSKLNKKKIKQK